MTISQWLHHLFSPHCQHCEMQRDQELMLQERINACRSCESLKIQLEHERAEKNKLLEVILNRSEPKVEIVTSSEGQSPIPISRFTSWPRQRAELERKSQEEYERIQKARIPVDTLEKEAGVKSDG